MRSPYTYDPKLRQRITAPPGEGDITVNIVGMRCIETVENLDDIIDEEGEVD